MIRGTTRSCYYNPGVQPAYLCTMGCASVKKQRKTGRSRVRVNVIRCTYPKYVFHIAEYSCILCTLACAYCARGACCWRFEARVRDCRDACNARVLPDCRSTHGKSTEVGLAFWEALWTPPAQHARHKRTSGKQGRTEVRRVESLCESRRKCGRQL